MKHWFTQPDAPIRTDFVKRFDPLHWTVDFPRGSIASLVTSDDGHGLSLTAEFLRLGDLVGVIFESEDRLAHVAHRRETNRDYSGCVLSFRWQSAGAVALDAVNGPTLTIEGRDANGAPRSWFVRLWNYADGTPTDAAVTLDFDALDGGFMLPEEADRIDPRDIDRMFISVVPPDYVAESEVARPGPAVVGVEISDIRCDGAGSVLAYRDAVVPEHKLRIATAYDDMYNLPPVRIVEAVERLGYRGVINHYIGMSHYFALGADGKVDAARPFNSSALEWHQAFAAAATARGYEVIWSLSYEILDMFCPEAWKQRAFDGSAAATGYDPPSALVSPANGDAIAFLASVARKLVQIAQGAGLRPRVQIGEPWWWVTADGRPCVYDDAAQEAFGDAPVEIANVRGAMTAEQVALLDQAGALLADSTAAIAEAVKGQDASAETLLLVYLPGPLDPEAPEIKRANLPAGWSAPAFDVLQLEDYEWVTERRPALRAAAYAEASARLGYPVDRQHYLAGFVPSADSRAQWSDVLAAAGEARGRGVADVFLWALPQVVRDGLTIFADDEEQGMQAFEDIVFPIEIGIEASVLPGFSTNVVTSASGHEYRNANWQQARLRFDAGPGVRSDAEMELLIAFFRARRGPAVGFRFRDPYDFSSAGLNGTVAPTDQAIGTGDGANNRFLLTKRYGQGEVRRITRPVTGSVRVAIDGIEQVGGWVLGELGAIVFAAPPPEGGAVSAGFEFDVPVRFADDHLEVNRASFLAGEAPSVPLVEIREG